MFQTEIHFQPDRHLFDGNNAHKSAKILQPAKGSFCSISLIFIFIYLFILFFFFFLISENQSPTCNVIQLIKIKKSLMLFIPPGFSLKTAFFTRHCGRHFVRS